MMTQEFAPSRFRPFFQIVTYAIGAVAGLVALATPAIARADVGDPIATAQGSVDSVLGTLFTYGPVIGGMYVLYAVASALLARYRSSSWLAQGKRLAIATGTLGIAGAALQAQIAGSPWTLVLAAAVSAAFKLLTPTVNPPVNPTTKSGSLALGSIQVAAALIAIVAISCGAGQSSRGASAGVGAGLECETPNIQNAVTQLLPAFVKLVKGAILGDGSLDRGALKAAAQPFRDTAMKCAMDVAVATVVALFSSAPPTSPSPSAGLTERSATISTTAPDSGTALRSGWAEIRSELGWAPAAATSTPRD